jgi:hypothetical protein
MISVGTRVSQYGCREFRDRINYLIGARIIDADGSYYSAASVPRCEVDNIIVATTDGRQFVISGMAYYEGDPELEIEEVVHQIKVARTIEDILQNCAKLRGVSGLSWRTMHEFFWFVSSCKWGKCADENEEERAIYEKYNERPVGMRTSFDEMLTEWTLLFEEYCIDEYGEIND